MDTDIDVFIESGGTPFGAFAEARLTFEQQEQRFSRFRETSLLSRLNRGETIEDSMLAEVVEMALDAFETTGGLFNPMVLGALQDAGYNRTFREVSGGRLQETLVPEPRSCVSVDGVRVTLSAGLLDLGGIVKGWTADIVAESLAERFGNVFVNAGGDIRAIGSDGAGEGWAMDVAGTSPEERVWEGRVIGGIATSTTLKRRWKTGEGGDAHHLIDPRTGLPANAGFLQVTARAEECWIAEVWAKAILIGGREAQDKAAAFGVSSIGFEQGGQSWLAGDWSGD
jgi:thiamine biosynthesis lipoprotein